MSEERKVRKHPVIRGILFTILGLWAVVLIAMQVVLNSKVLTKIANNLAAEYVDGDISFGEINASVIKSFPNLNVSLTDFSITYPHDRFAEFDSCGVKSFFRRSGRGEVADTLASVDNLSISLNYLSIAFGKIRIPSVTVHKPRFFLHQYDSTKANWNLFILPESQEDTSDTEFNLPDISIGEIILDHKPRVIYTNIADTLFASVRMKQFDFDGRLGTKRLKKNKFNLDMDSLFVTGRLPADTLALSLEKFKVNDHRKHMDFKANAKAFLALRDFGRMMVPIDMSGELSFPKSKAIVLKDFKADIATVSLNGEGELELGKKTRVKAGFNIEQTSVAQLLDFIGKNIPDAKKIKTDACLSAGITCKGEYDASTGSLPDIEMYFKVPSAQINYDDIPQSGVIAIDLNVAGKGQELTATLNDFTFNFSGIDLALSGEFSDLMSDDPLISIRGNGNINLSDAAQIADPELGLNASGKMKISLGGKARLSQMDIYNFKDAAFTARISGDSLRVSEAADTVDAFVFNPLISLAPDKGQMVAKFSLDSLNATYGTALKVAGSKILLKAINGTDVMNTAGMVHPFIGRVNIGGLRMVADSAYIGLRQSGGEFKMTRKPSGKYFKPEMNIKARLGRFFYRESVNRVALKNLDFTSDIIINTYENAQKRKHFMDSLAKVYPGVPKDSIFRMLRQKRLAGRPVPDFVKEKDFRKSDIDIRLDRETGKYLMDWDIKGTMDLEKGLVITPYFPLRNRLSDIHGTFDNDKIELSSFTFSPGESEIMASGVLKGLRRALTMGGVLFLDMKIGSKNINANELIAAADAGAKFQPEHNDALGQMSDEEYLSQVATDTLANADSARMALFVVPANLIMNIDVDLDNIKYNNLNVECLSGKLISRERCLQITDTRATTNMGNIGFEAFYSTKTKKDLKAGFDLNLEDISADQVIALFPAVDTLMPSLKAFKGLLNCELAATTQIDTNMNLVIPSLNGVIKINGKNLEVKQEGAVKTLAKALMFRDKNTGKIDDMNVYGIVHDNKMEIFPFILKIDRYTLALNGMQKLDDDFKYHISVIKSPVPFRFGINIFGTTEKWKWRLGKAAFKNTNIPVFVSEIDTMKVNLVNSIHEVFKRGVNKAFQSNSDFNREIEEKKQRLNYSSEFQSDSLNKDETAALDSLNYAYEHPEDSLAKAKANEEAMRKAEEEALQEAQDTENQMSRKEIRQQNRLERKQRRAEKKAAKQAAKKND